MSRGLFSKSVLMCSLALACLLSQAASAAESVASVMGGSPSPLKQLCILVYERAEHPIGKAMAKYFPAQQVGLLKFSAVPRDFETCLTGPFNEVLVIAHGAQMPNNGQWVLVYREGKRAALFLNRVFQNTLEALKAQPGAAPKKLRLANCALEEVVHTYPSLRELVESKLVEVDVAPPAPWPFQGDGVIKRSLTFPWLAQSSTCEGATEWATELNTLCRSDAWTGCDRSDASLACFGTKF